MDWMHGGRLSQSTNRVSQRDSPPCSRVYVLQPRFTTAQAFETDLRQWEAAVRRYEESARVQVSDEIKCAVVAQSAPKLVKQYLKLAPSDLLASYSQLRAAVFAYLARDRA